jgi:hypothetical protein
MRANKARLEADARCHLAEKERDIYRLLALRSQRDPASNRSLRHQIEEDMDIDDLEEAATAILFGGGTLHSLGLRGLVRRLQNHVLELAESETEEGDDDSNHEHEDASMEEASSESMHAGEAYFRQAGGRQVRAVSIGEDV